MHDGPASPHVVSVKATISGTFPNLTVSSTSVARRYYSLFPDERDFLFLGYMFNTGGAPAASFGVVRNNVTGIGLSTFDSSSSYGSAGVLQGVMNIYWGNARSYTLNHELLHRWASYLDQSLNLSAVSGSFNAAHWGAIQQNSTGFSGPDPYGGAFDHLELVSGSEYRGWLDGNVSDTHYGPLELYLMGLSTYSELPATITALVRPAWDRYVYVGSIRYSHYIADGMRDVPKSEIVSVAGPRVPAPGAAQSAFRSGLVVVYDRLLTPTEMAYWEYAFAEWEKTSSSFQELTFQQATGNRASISTYVPLVAGVVPDGRWVPGTPLRVSRTANPEYVTLMWGTSCRSFDTDYVVYQGTLGSFLSHAPVTCSTSGSTAWTYRAGTASAYFLVAPRNARSEGSLGYSSSGAERSSVSSCFPREIGACTSP